MPRPKSLKTLFLETVLFISLFAMVGHLSVNFWERYVIQTELSKMKTSLHSLKETINHIGIAYDNLHKELKDLAEIAEKNPVKQAIQRKAPDKPERKSQSNLAQAILHDIQLQAAMATHEMKIGAVPSTDNQNTQKSLHDYKIDKNASTWTKTLTKKFNEDFEKPFECY
ncbi:uncharacterized protein LOC126369157 [Pectinophora gossypiella]|uniref:uncharacterized protein LOC126369157 n=1 Tax=Pectinophora gossypiella TaxID=13191 RepID=UPI00214EA54A|nr:uncharacterized protein LOC126369157 [Pectinophora gossypiella]